MIAFSIIAILIRNSSSQWWVVTSYLLGNITFTEYEGANATLYSGNFVKFQNTSQTANFITCINPPLSYITLNSTYPKIKTYFVQQLCPSSNCYWVTINERAYQQGEFISVDLFFQGTWSNDLISFQIGSFTYSFSYSSPINQWLTNTFCDNLEYDIKQVNFTLPNLISSNLIISSSNIGNGQVSIRNVRLLTYGCHPFCKTCIGIKQNQCTSCYYGTPTNGVCPSCPPETYFSSGCFKFPKCNFILPLCINTSCKFCGTTQLSNYQRFQNLTEAFLPDFLSWTIIYDPLFIDYSLTSLIHENYNFYGIFKHKTGITRYINLQQFYGYYVGVVIQLYIFNEIQLDCGIQFNFNQTYYGSIFRNNSGIQLHNFQYLDILPRSQYSTYSTTATYVLYAYFDIPQSPILFTAIGNYTYQQFYISESMSGWGLQGVEFFTHICTSNCLECDVSFQCKICKNPYYLYRDGTCISDCNKKYQKVIQVGSQQYCKDFDDQTRYSKIFIQEFRENFDPSDYPQYNLISQSGSNFLKGQDTTFHFYKDYQFLVAKFSRFYENLDPHHSISFAFTLQYGPQFPQDGQFIFTIESNPPLIKTAAGLNTLVDKIFIEDFSHSQNTLTVFLECFGPNNEPLFSYCSFYDFIIVMHYCQPYCLNCSDQYNCLQWNDTYTSDVIKFSSAECQSNEYYEFKTFTCVPCKDSCLQCTSSYNCTSCKPTFMKSQIGCVCKQNQYEEANQCFDCPIECKQCLSSSYCFDCSKEDLRILVNGNCVCQAEYYSVLPEVKCKGCDKICGICNGPTINDCLQCNSKISNIELVGSTCKCLAGYFYQASINQCAKCHISCLDCFNQSVNGCLTCDYSTHRIVKGLKCECESGYYEENDECISCPINEDSTLQQCYKYCSSDFIWHTIYCSECNIGFILIYNECLPFCGDSLINGYEQCEDGNNNMDDLCFNCQFQCPIHCLTCNQSTTLPCPDICGDQLISGIEECDDGNNIQFDGCYNCKYQCQTQCTKCIKGKCQECETRGWQIDPSSDPWRCKEVCGDQFIIGSEQCDDGNFNDQDGCKNCKNFCRNGCTLCDYNTKTCLSCEHHGFTPKEYYCFPIENDGILVTDPYGYFREICDQSYIVANSFYNHDPYCVQSNINGQYKCQQSQICSTCLNNECVGCSQGQTLINGFCYPKCGDSIKVVNEHCEDSFILPYKGCQNCLPKCQASCKTCDNKGLGCLICNFGYQIIDNQCQSICGDKFITSDEECDDGNLILEDGCHFCSFSCQDFCINCIEGKCYNCQENYLLVQARCHPILVYPIQKYEYLQCQLCQEEYELSSYQAFCLQQNAILDLCQITLEDAIQIYQIYQRNTFNFVFEYYGLTLYKFINCNQLFQSCLICNIDQCLECQSGYYLNQLMECQSKCGDEILTENEECEINQTNCLNCFYEKPQFCLQYFSGICLECDYGYYFNTMMNSCQSLCGDSILAQDEECDENGDCFGCKSICHEACLSCQKGICINCQQNYYLLDDECFSNVENFQYPYEIQDCLECLEIFQEQNQSNINFCVNQCLYNQQCNLIKDIESGNSKNIYYEHISSNDLNQGDSHVCGNGIIEGYEQCDDQNLTNDDYCNNLCEYGCYSNCEICINGFCVKCEVGWKVGNLGCESICGDSQIVGHEECDDNNNSYFDGCYECKYQCTQNCQICEKGQCISCNQDYFMDHQFCKAEQVQFKFGEQKHCADTSGGQCLSCLYGFLEPITSTCLIDLKLENYCSHHCISCQIFKCLECEDGYYGNACNDQIENINQNISKPNICNSNCLYCVKGICYQCQEGNYLFNNECIVDKIDQIQYVKYEQLCGDGIIQMFEYCDDFNGLQFDGCFTCKHSCDINCYQCILGICINCKEGYLLSDSSCTPNCGDGLISKYSIEQCDDGNTIENDGCYNCKFECQPHCLYCDVVQKCLRCIKGFTQNDKQCIPICGDGITIPEFEDCDDANDQPFDGCYKCKYQCSENCEICYQGHCYHKICPIGMTWMIDSCQPICGDNLVVDIEECDDGNLQEFDGCFNCKYSCIKNCQICVRGACQGCKQGFQLKDNSCIDLQSQKHYFSDYEEIIQNSKNIWICQDQECAYSLSPNLKMIYLNQTFSKQYVQVYFDQEVKLKETNKILQSQLFNIQLKNFDDSAYKIQIYPISEINYDLRNVSYEIEIENLINFNEKPVLQIDLINEVTNNNNQTVTQKKVQMVLRFSLYLTNEKREISIRAMTTNKALMIGAISYSIISLISGESSFFVEILDVLQYQSYLKYINVEYPENLVIYFQASEVFEISTYLKIMQFDQIFSMITLKEESTEVDGKLKQYNVESDLFTNIVPQVLQTIILLAILNIGNYIYKLLTFILNLKNNVHLLANNLNSVKLYIIKIFNRVRICIKEFILMKVNFNTTYIRPFIVINAWDLLFKVIISLHYMSFGDYLRNNIQYFMSLTFLCFYLYFILQSLKFKINNKDRISIERSFQSLDIGRKLFFHLFLVVFQENQILQTILISINSFIQCLIIKKFSQTNLLGKIVSLVIEGSVTLCTFTSFLYFSICREYVTGQSIISTGFFHIGLLLSSLVIVILKYTIVKLSYILKMLQQSKMQSNSFKRNQ